MIPSPESGARADPPLDAPKRFDGFVLERLLGRGGMGAVYLAHDTLLDRMVAIKLIAGAGDAEARQRFLVEARAVARLEHPNVVGVYRVGEVQGMPYLVSEYVRGTPLDRIERPVDAETALRIAIDLASGLATAHRRGVLHRDIKPANAILSEGGIKLLDFGIAKLLEGRGGEREVEPQRSAPPAVDPEELTSVTQPDRPSARRADVRRSSGVMARRELAGPVEATPLDDLTRTGVALGTPRYMAPEVWRGEAATFASDVYSLGALLFTLCAGRPVHAVRDIDELRRRVLEHDAEPLAPLAPTIDQRLASIVDRCLQRDAASRYDSAVELRAAISALLPGARDAVVPDGNPYRGLGCFEAEHKNLYFGRDSESRMVLDRLAHEGFVLVAGDSGVGKSSLCRAGVVPRLGAWLGQEGRWTAIAWVPGPSPVTAVAAVLAPLLERTEKSLAREILDDPGGVARAVRALSGAGGGVLMLVDQLEELVTLAEPSEAAAVAELLGWLAVPAPGARLLATARGDFLSRLAQLPRLGELVSRALFFVRPLSPERIREAIVGPAAAKHVTFASAELVDELVDSATRAGDGALPLLQFALAEMWEARDESGTISASTLAKLGGVNGALCRHADDVVSGLSPVDRQAAQRVLAALVSTDGTRTRKSEAELGEGTVTAIRALVRGRLLTVRDTPEGARYAIAHEALIAHWQTLRDWLSTDAEVRAASERLDAAVAEWTRHDRPRDALLSERRLAEVTRLGLELDGDRRALVVSSRRQLRRRMFRRVAAVLLVPLALLGTWVALQAREGRALRLRIDDERAAAAAVMEEAATLAERSDEARATALAAFDRGDPHAETLWTEHQRLAASLRARQGEAGRVLEQALTLDVERLDVRSDFADLLMSSARLADQRGDRERRDELLQRLRVFDDGTRAAGWNAPASVSLGRLADIHRYEERDGRLQLVSVHHQVAQASLPPGSYLAVADGVRLPFVAHRGETLTLSLEPAPRPVPEGFVYVPAGRFLVGSDADDVQRRDFFHAVPLHEVTTDAYVVARHETTFGEWIAFLDDLPAPQRQARLPHVGKGGFKGSLELTHHGDWTLRMQPTTVALEAVAGKPITYPGRSSHATQDWLRLPVVGIAAADAEAYAQWLDRTSRVAGARLCSDWEWERAARGADGRPYPHGLQLAPADANHDATYGKRSESMGPDEVGSHSASRSPFDVDDMAGNVWEWTRSPASPTGFAARGGSWYFGPSSSRVDDREETEASFRDVSVGLRICADAR